MGTIGAFKFRGAMNTILQLPKIENKVDGTAFWGANIVTYDRNNESREEIGNLLAKKLGATIIPPFDDVNVIIGQGTAGLECVEQLTEIGVVPDIVLCCCGGGGLIAGVSTAIKAK